MNVPILSINAELKRLWPETRLGCLFYEADVRKDCPEIWKRMDTLLPPLRTRLQTTQLADMPNLGEAHAAYKAFGKDPGRFRISSEALYRRVRQNKDLYRINSIVDCNNLVSLESGFSLGSYNLDALEGNPVFRLGKEGEIYAGIGKADMNLHRMPLLADRCGAFGSPTSDSTRAMITDSTRRMLTVIYSFSSLEELERTLALAKEYFSRFAGITNPYTCIADGTE